jgi:hypothetical protein
LLGPIGSGRFAHCYKGRIKRRRFLRFGDAIGRGAFPGIDLIAGEFGR